MISAFQFGAFQLGAFQTEGGGGDSTYWRSPPKRRARQAVRMPDMGPQEPQPQRVIRLKAPPRPPANRPDTAALAQQLSALFERFK